MANAPTGGTPTPEDEDGNKFQYEQQNEEDQRRQQMPRDETLADSPSKDEQSQLQPTRPSPGPAAAQAKSETLPSDWQDILAERLTRLNDTQRAQYELQLLNAMERNGAASPRYQLDLAALIAKDLPKFAYGRDLDDLNRHEDEIRRRELLSQQQAADRQQRDAGKLRASSPERADPPHVRATSNRQADSLQPSSPNSVPAVRREPERGEQQLPPRKAPPDRTRLVHKRLQRIINQQAERRRELKLAPNRAEQNDLDRLDFDQQAARKALLDRHSRELKLLDYQHVAERTAVAAKWLARDLKQRGAPDAVSYQSQADEALRAAGLAHERRQTLLTERLDPHGWNDAASSSTHGGPSPAQDGLAHQRAAPLQPQALNRLSGPAGDSPATPRPQDPTAFFMDAPRAGLLTEDRLRGMLGRYEELRENRSMPSGVNEGNEQARLTTAQATVRKNLLALQNTQTQLLDYQQLAERAGTGAEWLAQSTDQLRYRAEARRAFSVARFAMERRYALDPRARAEHDRVRGARERADRQARLQEAAKGGHVLSSDERASLPSSAPKALSGRSTRPGERFAGPQQGDGRGRGGGPASRGGGGRSR